MVKTPPIPFVEQNRRSMAEAAAKAQQAVRALLPGRNFKEVIAKLRAQGYLPKE